MSITRSLSNSPSQSSEQDAQLRERVSATFEKLAVSAAELNVVSDEIAKPIHAIDAALQKLNLGISAWVQVVGGNDFPDGDFWWDRSIGYDKIDRRWGIAIRARSGYSVMDRLQEDAWRFDAAPRSYRLEALDKLPELLEQLVDAASKTAKALKSKVAAAEQVATTISQMASSTRVRGK